MWPEKHGKTYRIREEIGDRKVTVASGFATKTEARNAIVLLRADQLRGDALVPRGGKMLLREWVDVWLPLYEASVKPSTAKSETRRVRNHILPLLGHLPLEELEEPVLVLRWMGDLAGGRHPSGIKLAPKSVRNCHGLLYKILQAAVKSRLIRHNVCTETAKSLPARAHKEMRFLTDPEIGRLIAAMDPRYRPLVLLLVGTGLRWGEAIGLRVKHVDVLAGKLTVLQTLHEIAGQHVFTEPKTARSRRTVSFTKQVGGALAGLVVGKEREDMVFTAPTGGMIRHSKWYERVWQPACVAAGLGGWEQAGQRRRYVGLRVHDLRHTHAAILISDGRPLSAISRRLGHSSVAITDTLYGHLREEVDEGMLAAVDAALAGIDLDALDAEVADELVGA